jgi:hypothetical protein
MVAYPSVPKNPRTDAGKKAEAEYRKQMAAGKVTPKNIEKVKATIQKKFGVWPNGDTN